MLQNYYTILKLQEELSPFIGMKLIELFSQEKDSITFNFYDGVQENFLYFSIVPLFTSLFIYNNFSRAKSNTINLCPELLGDYLQAVNVMDYERIVELKFIKHSVVFHIFGGANGNMFVCNEQHANKYKIIFSLNKYPHSELVCENRSILGFLKFNRNETLLKALTQSQLLLGKYYAVEFCKQNNLAEKTNYLLNEFSEEELVEIENKAKFFCNYLLSHNKSYSLITNGNITDKNNSGQIIFSLIPLSDYQIIKEFDTVSSGLKYTVIRHYVESRKKELFNDLLSKLKRISNNLIKNISIAKNIDEPLERSDKYRLYAEIIMSQPNIKQRVGENVELSDWNGNIVNIKLDAKLNLLENANKYFIKSRKSLEDAENREKRLPILEKKLEKNNHIIAKIENCNSIKELEKIKVELIEQSIIIMQNEERPISTKFRVFDLGDGYTLYVGKNAANNDELTMKFAKPNDVWLHARGSSGSHCVVKGGNNEGKLPKPILKSAAEIAAYYSGSKNAKYTPVCYTQKKYVHKPKGANVGAVSLQREEIIMVEPKLKIEQQDGND